MIEQNAANATPREAPRHGEHAADLIYDTEADTRRGGLWLYPACYDDFSIARQRAHSLSTAFHIPFAVDLFGAAGRAGALTPSVAVDVPGYYAYTLADPRPHVVYIGADEGAEIGAEQQSADEEQGKQGEGSAR